jgi:hypothetical protein
VRVVGADFEQSGARASAGWRGFTMTPAGLRLLADLRRSLHDPPTQLPQRNSEVHIETELACADSAGAIAENHNRKRAESMSELLHRSWDATTTRDERRSRIMRR